MKIESTHHRLTNLNHGLRLLRSPSPPYYAVISTNIRPLENNADYDTTMSEMIRLVTDLPGFLGAESAVETIDNTYYKVGVIYWLDLESLNAWRNHTEHRRAKEKGIANFYLEHNIRICQVLEQYGHNLSPCEPNQCAYKNRDSVISSCD
jgi:heme-degrading monooxygenase HmoA